MPEKDDIRRKQIVDRLSRIEGQVRGIRRMVEDERACHDILKQVAATSGALRSASLLITENFLESCFQEAAAGETTHDEVIRRLIEVFSRLSG